MTDLLTHGTALIGIFAFAFSVWQYIDTRKRELNARRFEQFHNLFIWVAGRTAEGNPLVDTQQAMAVYELAEFPEFARISLPIVRYYLERTTGEPDTGLFRRALLQTESKLEKAQ